MAIKYHHTPSLLADKDLIMALNELYSMLYLRIISFFIFFYFCFYFCFSLSLHLKYWKRLLVKLNDKYYTSFNYLNLRVWWIKTIAIWFSFSCFKNWLLKKERACWHLLDHGDHLINLMNCKCQFAKVY